MKTKVLLTIFVLIAIAITAVVAHGETAVWSPLNQVLDNRGARGYFRYSPQAGIYCAGVVVLDRCDYVHDGSGNFFAELDTYGNLDCHTNPNKPSIGSLWYLADNNHLLITSAGSSGRIYAGDQVVPRLVLNYPCSVQILDNNGKKNLRVIYEPVLSYP